MKKIYLLSIAAALMFGATSCIQEFEPQNSSVTEKQASEAPGAYQNFVNAITSNISGKPMDSRKQPNDFGYTSFYLQWDVMGQDMVPINNNWFGTWYECGIGLAPIYLNCQYPWTFFFVQIKSCNTVLQLAGEEPADNMKEGAGIAHCMRALYYLNLAQMFAPTSYAANPEAPTVPITSEKVDLQGATTTPRAPYNEMMQFILSDLDAAETLLAGYSRPDKYHPDLSVVNGIRARAYLIMEDWANAEKYAKLAQSGYSPLTPAQYTDRDHGFNDANFGNSWMLACTFKSDDTAITYNDGDSSWGTWMICEFPTGSTGLGYYNAYGGANVIDRHLYETIPSTDCRKKCFIDFSLDDLSTKAEVVEALKAYSDVPENVYGTGLCQNTFGGLPMKFRSRNGNHINNQEGYCVDVPMMRVEEMMLIEAEAAGMQDQNRGIALLTAFAQNRDPNYVYGTHNEAYNNTSTPAFRNEVWWQRRVEFWGEGLATQDIKRLQKGIIRSYPGSNHKDGYRWNTQTPPDWMNLCIVQTETNYNSAIVNNPTPIAPTGNSPEYNW